MKRMVLAALLLVEIAGSASAQRDDLYFVPKKKVKIEAVAKESGESAGQETVPVTAQEKEPMVSAGFSTKALEMDEDAYNHSIHGIMVQLPLLIGWDSSELIEKIPVWKDVDGLKK